MIKRIFVLAICAALCLSLIPSAFADEETLWERIDTGEVISMTSEPSEDEMENLTLHVHTFGPWFVPDSPYCPEAGTQYRVCTTCGYKDVEIIGPTEHDFIWWSTIKEPTCTSEGYGYQRCLICGYKQEVIIPRTQHVFGPWETITEATDHSYGLRERTCYSCGYTHSESYAPHGTLKPGDTGLAVRELQALLAQQGYLQEAYVDGDYSYFTEKAVTDFQKDLCLTADGIAWPQTMTLLHHNYGEWEVVTEPDYYTAACLERVCEDCGYKETKEIGVMLQLGDYSDDVKTLQKRLNALGYDVGYPDGLFGDGTKRAVKNYQKDHDLEEDGIVWPGVWTSLFPEDLSDLPAKAEK